MTVNNSRGSWHLTTLFPPCNVTVWRLVRNLSVSTWRDREPLCQILRTMFSHHQVCLSVYPCSSASSQYSWHICNSFSVIYLPLLIVLVYISEVNDGQKRRRLGVAGQENRSPKPSTSGRLFELGTKPDTPIVPSVHSRVQQLTQRRDGNNNLLWCSSSDFKMKL